eukprot:11198881-Lingulodinium_polyedra.AAC.1
MTSDEYYLWWRNARQAAAEAFAKSKAPTQPEPETSRVEKAVEKSAPIYWQPSVKGRPARR